MLHSTPLALRACFSWIIFCGIVGDYIPHQKGQVLLTGGSQLGQTFLEMFLEDQDPCGLFMFFVKGQAALKKNIWCRTSASQEKKETGGNTEYDRDLQAKLARTCKQLESSLGKQFLSVSASNAARTSPNFYAASKQVGKGRKKPATIGKGCVKQGGGGAGKKVVRKQA
ncbi:hypothetical protein VP01_2780g2 [Puccinia sorghi]|uniref:Uncharacterized protein n=1 Tax=Puccinia sorghi TaxID=27349 RepID=A0A0L6V4H3_9BASI|nr:hypothetical protein VP01_2782g1 [Puccinia sorghi]KNZ55050.1 hypothetical protein VP01_2780g2 [Puccinia sorghi]